MTTAAPIATYRVSARNYRKQPFPERVGLSRTEAQARVERLRQETACTEYRVYVERHGLEGKSRDLLIESCERKNGEWIKRDISKTVVPMVGSGF